MIWLVLRCGRETKRGRPAGRGAGRAGRRMGWARLLLRLLPGLGVRVELGGRAVLHGDSEGLLDELAGLAALGAGIALRLYGHLAGGRDGDLDDALRHD